MYSKLVFQVSAKESQWMIPVVLRLCQIYLEPGQCGRILADCGNESGTMVGILDFGKNVGEPQDGVAPEIRQLVVQLPHG